MAIGEGPMSTAQTNALVVALIYEPAGEPTFRGSRGVKSRTLDVLTRRGLEERDDHHGYRLTEAGRALAPSLNGGVSVPGEAAVDPRARSAALVGGRARRGVEIRSGAGGVEGRITGGRLEGVGTAGGNK